MSSIRKFLVAIVLAASLSTATVAHAAYTVSQGGTGVSIFGQGWIYSSGTTTPLAASTSPTVASLTATSTATSTFTGGVSAKAIDLTATSTGKGFNLSSGCFAIGGTCLAAFSGTAASSTVLSDANTWSGTNTFSNGIRLLDSLWYIQECATCNLAGSDHGIRFAANGASSGRSWTFYDTNASAARASINIADGTAYFSGKVGIATSSPYATLSVAGQIVGTNVVATSTTQANVLPNASTTNLTASQSLFVGSNRVSGERYPVFSYATSTTWTGTSTVNLIAPFSGTLSDIQCATDAGTLNTQMLVNPTNVSPMLNASTTKGTETFSSNNTFSRGDTLKAQFGTPASSPTRIDCTARANGF